MRRFRRWFAYRFQTRVKPARFNRHRGRILTTDEWERLGGWDDALVPGWYVERRDWWDAGSSSGVTDESVEKARARLDEWQEDQARRAQTK